MPFPWVIREFTNASIGDGALVSTSGDAKGEGSVSAEQNGLGMRILISLALQSVVSQESALKALSLVDALGPFSGGEFREGDGVTIHGISIRGGLRGRGVEGEGKSSSF